MNCQNCGKDEVNFHFTSNINGNITEKHLCADCADKLGFNEKLQKPEASFEEIFSELFGGRPNRRMLGGYGLMFPTFIIPTMGMLVTDRELTDFAGSTDNTAETAEVPVEKPAVDAEMQKRREINVMREQMKKAAADEDFEKAACLRDSIKKLENNESL